MYRAARDWKTHRVCWVASLADRAIWALGGITFVSQNQTAEHRRLSDSAARRADWKNWGPYVAERAWGTVREDYSASGDAWNHFPHDQARSRAYRWNEDGLAGYCNRFQNLCMTIALWNERVRVVPRGVDTVETMVRL